MSVILVVWTVVGLTTGGTSGSAKWDWRPIGDFQNTAVCQEAARQMAVEPARFRCLQKTAVSK